MMGRTAVEIETKTVDEETFHYVKGLPNLSELNSVVKQVIQNSTYWERHGRDLAEMGLALPLHLAGLYLCGGEQAISFVAGFVLLGLCHCVISNRAGHLASHNALFDSQVLNKIATWICVEFNGFFSLKEAKDIHIKIHHPYTNIIGLGDSSSWKAPSLPRYLYLYIAPLALSLLAPLVSLQKLKGQFLETLSFLICISAGLLFHVYLIMKISGFQTFWSAVCFMFAYRAVTGPSYIHINVFQHIGLPMYSLKNRPAKLYQMSTGVLNLHRVALIDWTMGHALFYCHIEHHLFPMLSDNMCLKIRPLVKRFMEQHGLPYTERHYTERLALFAEKYEELMVKAPPFTHFVGLQ